MTQAELNNLTYEELVDVCYAQERKFCEWRGQDSGLTKKMMVDINFPKETLIDCYLKTQKTMTGGRV